MTQEGTTRKLAAILNADVKEYSRLMSQDEIGTIRTLTAYKEAMTKLIEEYKGRVVDTPGDNLLAEFGSVGDAVNCAVEIQRELAERNAELPYNRQMEFRIGINLGDVVYEEGRIYGDGVNIAARVESLAEGGGICISGAVYDSVQTKLGFEYEFLGEQDVKNIPEPVRIYRVLSFPGAAAHRVVRVETSIHMKWGKAALAIGAVLIIGVGAAVIWNLFFRAAPPSVVPASIEKMAFPLPNKPSTAVMPFVNMSDEPKQEFFSDGITEEIITALSKVPDLFVIARNSTFTYKGKAVKVQQVAEELGVQYVLEDSVRRAGNKVRITAQLVDAITGNHLWAERYDRGLRDIFALQDEITKKVLTALQVKLTIGEQARSMAKGTDNLEAYLKILQARALKVDFTIENLLLMRQLAEEAISLDPKYAAAHVILSSCYRKEVWYGLTKTPGKSLDRSLEMAQKALALDENLATAHSSLGTIYNLKRQFNKAITEMELAISLNPNDADNHANLGRFLHNLGRTEESIAEFKKAIRLNPHAPSW
jgi:TolB-like protein/class 3 adenylate cyclase